MMRRLVPASSQLRAATPPAHSIALHEDGTAVTWGSATQGERDDTPSSGGFVAIACGDSDHSAALRDAVDAYCAVADKYDLTPAQLALAWCYSRKHVTSTIIGATSLDQLRENIEAYEIELPEECLEDVNAIYKNFRDPSKTS